MRNTQTANISAIWQHAAHTTDQLLLATKQEPYIKEISGKSRGQWASWQQAEEKKHRKSNRTRQKNKKRQ